MILVVLLERFLYGPITRAMETRERGIAETLDEAREEREEARRRAAELARERDELESVRERMLARAREETERRREEMLEEARRDVERIEHRWRESVEREREAFLEDLGRRVESCILAVAQRAVRDLADEDLERRVVIGFLHRLREASEEERRSIVGIVRESDRRPRIRTRWEVPDDLRARVVETLEGLVEEEIDPRFETSPELGFGIELAGAGRRLGWTLADYVGELEERVDEALDEAFRSRVGGGGEPEPERQPAGSEPAVEEVEDR